MFRHTRSCCEQLRPPQGRYEVLFMDTSRVRIWDLVVRSFHWLVAAAFVAAFAIATLADDDGTFFPMHALIGMGVVFMVVLRIVWGLIGTRWARFSSLELRPSALFAYLRGAVGMTRPTEHAGHNPATSWFVVASLVVFLLLGASGFMNARGNESAEEVHETLAWTMVALAGIHIVGIAVATVRTRENVALSMISGMKTTDTAAGIASARTWSALVFVALTAIWAGMLISGYDRVTGRLTFPIIGTSLQLSEAEGNERVDVEHAGHED